ncbi:MAG TPA: DNA methyltransferase, partial [Bryobacteraceae bacterium]|nr:DNA methyltransferase [Bryobacteraceae bacterium]
DWLNRPEADAVVDDSDPFYGFRYVNGGLFQERLSFARFDRGMHEALQFCCDFQWAKVSPAVFGSLFQGVLQDRDRRQQGAHYTSERDIMKVLRSLFLDDLQSEWQRILADKSTRRRTGIEGFHHKLRTLHFLDPACGCGNFLVLAYRELRRLEIDVVRELTAATGGQQRLPELNVDQFYGIEISEWPVRIAEVALWLMDHQMNQEASDVFGQSYDRLPLSSSPHIIHANALSVDWKEILHPEHCSYILGNPPFVGHHLQTEDQRADQKRVLGDVPAGGVLDYVCNWYVKAAQYIQGFRIPVAFVSTNSISQGEQPGILWSVLFPRYHLKIHFAHRTFDWTSDARGKANVDVVVIGFGAFDVSTKKIYDYEHGDGTATVMVARNISPYLFDGSDAVLLNRPTPLCQVPGMRYGNKPTDGGNFILTPAERDRLLEEEPGAAQFVHLYVGADEFLEGSSRYCLWLTHITPAQLRALPRVRARVAAVRAFRLASKAKSTRNYAKYATLFRQIAQPRSEFILVPGHTSEDRKYIPFAYLTPDVIVSNACFMIPDAGLFHFAVLTSSMHMAWVRTFCGRLESRYRYSKDIVYNNFPWPNVSSGHRSKIETTAERLLQIRAKYLPPNGMSTLADLYDPLTMPAPLVKAHEQLDRLVEKAYRPEAFHSDRERVEFLFRTYEQLNLPLLPTVELTRNAITRGSRASAPKYRTPRTPQLRAAEPSEDS